MTIQDHDMCVVDVLEIGNINHKSKLSESSTENC
jgi:hypothetical protein